MFNKIIEDFDTREFESIEDFQSAVKLWVSDMEEELGRVERWALQDNSEIYSQLGVVINEVLERDE